MCHRSHFAAALTAAVLFTAPAFAQPPEGGQGGERRGPPSPERMVEHAMKFDADGDGKLDRAELSKFAEEFHAMRQRGGPGGPGGGPGRQGGQGGQGRGPGGGRGQGRGGPEGRPDNGEQPARPFE